MILRKISEPIFNQKNQQFRDFLMEKEFSIEWYLFDKLDGDGRQGQKNKKIITITFKKEDFTKNQCLISHELLHGVLSAKGVPRITIKEDYSAHLLLQKIIDMLNSLFDHVIMDSELKKIKRIRVKRILTIRL